MISTCVEGRKRIARALSTYGFLIRVIGNPGILKGFFYLLLRFL